MDESWFSLILLWNWFGPIHVIMDYGLLSCHEDNGYGFPIGILWWMTMDYDQVASFLRHLQEECVMKTVVASGTLWRVCGSHGPRLVKLRPALERKCWERCGQRFLSSAALPVRKDGGWWSSRLRLAEQPDPAFTAFCRPHPAPHPKQPRTGHVAASYSSEA